jgi:hypothetical protein
MAQATDVRAQVERARERLAEDVQALAYQANVPARMKDRMSDRFDPAARRALIDSGIDDIRRGHRSTGLRKIGGALRTPAIVVGAAAAAVAVTVTALRARSHTPRMHDPSANGSRPSLRPGAVVGVVARPSVMAAMHYRQMRKSGRSPSARHFVGYAAVGTATTLATRWANGRIDRSAAGRSDM